MGIITRKCRLCPQCDGLGCVGELPGMGGVFASVNFRLNVASWDRLAQQLASWDGMEEEPCAFPEVYLAPMTGAVENVGYRSERDFYFDLISACAGAGIKLSVGDGVPDEKLMFGLAALKANNARGAVFIKPYPDKNIFERLEAALPVAEAIGIDIDSYAIITMRNLARLERKSARSLKKIKERVNKAGLPFAIKGVFLPEEIALVKEVMPDIIVVSNHGGRVETRQGATADFLAQFADKLKPCCDSLWVDGGLRRQEHLVAAGMLGADAVMIGRPFASALLAGGSDCVKDAAEQLTGMPLKIAAGR